ncbi:MAG: pyridoxamine 5'-phosphate oxidase family protein [bacterium]|nr:pyridoxamine 5'-phosphate oxidase family protein [bacterium]
MRNFDWNKQVKEALERTHFMALSTIGADGIWTCPVFFSYDNKLNLYFKSMPPSKHMQNIIQNPEVSLAIFSTARLPDGSVVGLQIKGSAKILKTKEEVDAAAKINYARSRPEIDYKTRVDEHLDKNAVWNFVKITPTEAWYFDTRFFDEEKDGRQKVPIETLHL